VPAQPLQAAARALQRALRRPVRGAPDQRTPMVQGAAAGGAAA